MNRILCAAIACAIAVSPLAARAQAVALNGAVIDDAGKPVTDAFVSVSGQNVTLHQTTNQSGRFTFATLTVGSYTLTVSKNNLVLAQPIELTSSGLTLNIALSPLKTIGRVSVVTNPVSRKSGTDVSLSGSQLVRTPTGGSIASILTQMPAAARGTNDQVHVNGDHNGLNYYIDGVQLPASLNRVAGGEVDPNDIGYLDLIEGAYPAMYGGRFAAVLNIGTRAYAGPAGYTFDANGGSYGTYGSTLSLHAPVGSAGGSYSFSATTSATDWALDPAVGDPVHNEGSSTNQLFRLTLPESHQDTLNLDVIHSLQTFQIAPDTNNGVPAQTDDNEYQNDFFASLQYRHAIGDHGSLQFGPAVKTSRILDTNDLGNDLAAAQGTSCTDFTDCVFSVNADRHATDVEFNADYDLHSTHHDVRAGALYDATQVSKNYVITLQPNNQLNPSGGTYTVTDTTPNVAHQQSAYLQDSWQMGNLYELDYGLRLDAFQVFSSQFDQGFSQLSPRIKFTRFFGPRASAYVYYGRLFVPFSFENVSPVTASLLYIPGSFPGTAYDLRPQRDSLYEIGGHVPLAGGDLGIRISHKVSTDWLDDTQVGATNLHQDINFPIGGVNLQSLYYQHPLASSGRFYASLTHSLAVNSTNCETQLLQNCALNGPPGGPLVAADHDQRWDANFGVLMNDKHGGWFALNSEYGSGLSWAAENCAGIANPDLNCKVPPHLTFNAEKGVALSKSTAVYVSVQNLFNDVYAITLNNSLQGTHYAHPRQIQLGVRLTH